MADAKQDPFTLSGKDQKGEVPCPLKGESELENLDYQAGHEYLPMDVYIDSKTMEEHFQASSIRNRYMKAHKSTN